MHSTSRRTFLSLTLKGTAALAFYPLYAYAANPCHIQHPISPPDMSLPGQCPNCGMVRPMWARTWKTFENAAGPSEACSFHCLADMALKSGEEPKNVMVALYAEPQKMVPAGKAFYVVGSSAPGTMTMKSKVAFASKSEAGKFAGDCGGSVAAYAEALQIAKDGISKEKQMIVQRRLKKGKIVEPVDDKDRCSVCGMYPARYPKHKNQIQTQEGELCHFCSTQCLFSFLADPAQYSGKDVKPFLMWVVDFESGSWISGRTAYYVVGSNQFGPMGKEAFAFDKNADAAKFAEKFNGKVIIFQGVTIEKITA
jgi:nitrous oxide reductase accessory protein NosL